MTLLQYKARVNRAKALKHLAVAAVSGRKHKRPAFYLKPEFRVDDSTRVA